MSSVTEKLGEAAGRARWGTWLLVPIAVLIVAGCNLSRILPAGIPDGTGGSGPTSGSGGGGVTLGVAGAAGLGGATAGLGGAPAGGSGGSGAAGFLGFDASLMTPICGGVAPGTALIADFNSFDGHTFGQVGIDAVIGATYLTPPLLTEDFSQGNWHIIGTVVGSTTRFGVYWSCNSLTTAGCTLDASLYAGIEFTISGNVGPTSSLSLTIGRSEDDIPQSDQGCGTCTASDSCRDPSIPFNLGPSHDMPQVIRVLWSDLGAGQPVASVFPHAITAIGWSFPAPISSTDAAALSYPVDFTVDDIRLVPPVLPSP